jgi:hypothetical protein
MFTAWIIANEGEKFPSRTRDGGVKRRNPRKLSPLDKDSDRGTRWDSNYPRTDCYVRGLMYKINPSHGETQGLLARAE